MQKLNRCLLEIILKEIENNPNITEKKLALKYYYSERTIRRYMKILKDEKKIKLEINGKNRSWKII